MSERVSTCCTASHDERFHFDDDYNEGICVQCKDHATFWEVDDE